MTTLPMNPTSRRLWGRLAKSKRYRDSFMAGFVKRSIPSQIKAWMKNNGLSQQKLAEQSGITQGVISRAANPEYGDLTLNTIIRIAAGLDCAFIGRFVPYSEFCRQVTSNETSSELLSFEKENEQSQRAAQEEPIEKMIAQGYGMRRIINAKGLGAISAGKIDENILGAMPLPVPKGDAQSMENFYAR